LIDTAEPGQMERGAALLPGDAESWDRLGRYYFLDFANPDPSRAITAYRKAVEIDPLSAHYWMDLANTDESVGDVAGAREAYQHAEQVYPASAEVAWNFGSFLLRQDDSRGYDEIRRAVRGDTTLLPLAISRVWRSSGDVNQLLGSVVPPNGPSLLAALDFFA